MNTFSIIILICLIFALLYFKKKLKKYKKIYNINGLDGVYYYFINKNFKSTGLNNFIDKKKNHLGIKISKIAKNRILNGPYKDTKILNLGGWSSVDYSSKYLGTYENNVQKKIIYLSKKFKLKNFVDLGAAEGFHIISLLKKNYFQNGYAFEIQKESRALLKKNAIVNKVGKKLKIFGEANFLTIKNNLKISELKKTLFLIDIEGNEYHLLNEDFCNYFSHCFFIIEDHKFNIKKREIIRKFFKNIKKKFEIEIIKDSVKNPFKIKELENYSDDDKYLMMSEGRPKTMQWIILYPKKLN
jgi:hypothetical protein